MAAEINQDFVTYKGDDVAPIFTVRDASGTPVDISLVNDITWLARVNADTAAAVTKTKSLGQIAFVTNGTDGKFQVTITDADTSALDGYYEHVAKLTDSLGNINTVTVGRMQVGSKPQWSYDPGRISTNEVYFVRDLIGDTKIGDQLLYDAEIQAALDQYPDNYLAAAECCRKVAARYARDVDTQQGELRILYSSRQKAYRSLAVELDKLGYTHGGVLGYAGGVSVSDKQGVVEDSDRVAPQFNIGMQDNFIPLSPVGNEQPAGPSSEPFSFP